MVFTRKMTKMMNDCLLFSHPALANAPEVKYLIVFDAGFLGYSRFEGYLTFEDAYGDFAFQKRKHGAAWIFKAAPANAIIAGGKMKKNRK